MTLRLLGLSVPSVRGCVSCRGAVLGEDMLRALLEGEARPRGYRALALSYADAMVLQLEVSRLVDTAKVAVDD